MALISSANRRPCPLCAFGGPYPFVTSTFVELFRPDDPNQPLGPSRVFEEKTVHQCRRCGYVPQFGPSDPTNVNAQEKASRLLGGPKPK